MMGIQPGGRFTATNIPLRGLIRQAYQLQEFQIVGAPDWTNNERFDIVAKAEGDVGRGLPGTVGPMQMMMQNLLAERFKLVSHRESRELPIYALVLARSDGKLGTQLRPSTVDCTAAGRGRAGPPPQGPPPVPAAGERPQCGFMIGPGTMAMGGFPCWSSPVPSRSSCSASSWIERGSRGPTISTSRGLRTEACRQALVDRLRPVLHLFHLSILTVRPSSLRSRSSSDSSSTHSEGLSTCSSSIPWNVLRQTRN